MLKYIYLSVCVHASVPPQLFVHTSECIKKPDWVRYRVCAFMHVIYNKHCMMLSLTLSKFQTLMTGLTPCSSSCKSTASTTH